jgi:DNA-binding response OmpR family regulator
VLVRGGRLRIIRHAFVAKDIWSGRGADGTVAAMTTALVLADPQPDTRGFLARHLADDGFEVLDADDPREAAEGADLVLLGDASALERWEPACPVIVLGAPDDDTVDRVRAFQRGCDDYVMRPIVYEELLERIRAVLRRTTPPLSERLQVGDLVVDRATRRVSIGGTTAPLAGKEFELLVQLASDPERVFTKEQLLRDVWGFRSRGRTRTLDSHASRLRRKLAAAGGYGYVVNVWGVGYKLVDA